MTRRVAPDSKLENLVRIALAAHDKLTPGEKEAFARKQRRAWVVGDILIRHPELGRAYVEDMLDRLGA